MAGKKKTRTVEKNLYSGFLKKAECSYDTFDKCIEDENWHSVGVNGVHACISIADAICVGLSGLKNAGDHTMGPLLLKEILGKYGISKDLAKHCQQYSEVINLKNLIEYEAKVFHKTSVQTLIKKTQRFYEWGRLIVEDHIVSQ